MSGSASRDRRLDELAKVAFTGSMQQVIGEYATRLRDFTQRWEVELAIASGDAKAAMIAMRGPWLGLDKPARTIRARRVVRRLRRAQTLARGISRRAEKLPKEYARQFLSDPEAAKQRTAGGAA